MIHGFSGCLCCIYILFRLLVFKLNMMMMMISVRPEADEMASLI